MTGYYKQARKYLPPRPATVDTEAPHDAWADIDTQLAEADRHLKEAEQFNEDYEKFRASQDGPVELQNEDPSTQIPTLQPAQTDPAWDL